MTWGDWVQTHLEDFKTSVRLYPLSVIPIREARAIIEDQLGPDASRGEVDRIWNETGGHPFLLGEVLGKGSGGELAELGATLWREVRPEEEAILHQLDPSGRWTILDTIKM